MQAMAMQLEQVVIDFQVSIGIDAYQLKVVFYTSTKTCYVDKRVQLWQNQNEPRESHGRGAY